MDEVKGFYHPGFLVVTSGAEHLGIDNRLISAGFRLDLGFSRPDSEMWYLKREDALIRYHPLDFPNLNQEGMITRIDFLGGEAPIIYDVCKAILDCGFRVGVPDLRAYIEEYSLFKKVGELYQREKVVSIVSR